MQLSKDIHASTYLINAQKAGSQGVNGYVLILLVLHGLTEMEEQIVYCFSAFGYSELYFMGHENQIFL